jgi:hypothetical protein
MHPELLKRTVQACREYMAAGDCHGKAPPVERLIDAVVQLADQQLPQMLVKAAEWNALSPTAQEHLRTVTEAVRKRSAQDYHEGRARLAGVALGGAPGSTDAERAASGVALPRTVSPPEFQEATWGVNSVMRPCKSMAISEYAFRQWAKDVGIVLADGVDLVDHQALSRHTPLKG